MTTRTVWYRCLTHSEESFYELKTTEDGFDRWMAKEAAKDYYYAHDGWEANWPLEFALHETENGPEIARFEVQREVESVFYATEIKRVEGKSCA